MENTKKEELRIKLNGRLPSEALGEYLGLLPSDDENEYTEEVEVVFEED